MEAFTDIIIYLLGFCLGMIFILVNGGKDNDD